MSKDKKAIIEFLITLIIVIGILILYRIIIINVENISYTPVDTAKNEKNKEIIEWNEITKDGVNEELLLQNVNTKYLEKIATLLQSLSEEIAQKEQDDIDFYLSAGWYKYVLDSQQFTEVINMGNDAIKPLYLIIYKSPNQGAYEYMCAMALSELVNFDNVADSWSTSKEFLEKFNQKVIRNILFQNEEQSYNLTEM